TYQTSSMKNSTSWPQDYGTLGLPEGGNDFAVNMGGGSGGPGRNVEYVSDSGPGRGTADDPRGGPSAVEYSGTDDTPGSGGAAPGDGTSGSYSGNIRPDLPAADTSTGTAGYATPGGSAGSMPGSPNYPGGGYGPGAGSGYGSGQPLGSGSNAGSTYGYGATPGYGSSSGYGS